MMVLYPKRKTESILAYKDTFLNSNTKIEMYPI